jgi:hypothetical protein
MTPHEIVIKTLTDRIQELEQDTNPRIEEAEQMANYWERRYNLLLNQVGMMLSFTKFEFTPDNIESIHRDGWRNIDKWPFGIDHKVEDANKAQDLFIQMTYLLKKSSDPER